MPRVIITAEVEDGAKWEAAYRTHGELLRSMTSTVTHFTVTGENRVVLYAEPDDVAKYMEVLESPATAAAMANDGVKAETVQVYVLDREFSY